jgi:hypothetical protein
MSKWSDRIALRPPGRRTRFHDEKGTAVSWFNAIRHGPRALIGALARITGDYRPVLPWLSYEAIGVIDKYLDDSSAVLEFGSGMSTLWYAERASTVWSVEDNEGWFARVEELLRGRGVRNVRYERRQNEDYWTFGRDYPSQFDLVMVDGSYRSRCIETAMAKVRPGGIIYLDNSDKDSGPEGGDMRVAESRLRAFADSRGASVRFFVDFAPGLFFVQQGMMVVLPPE